ncbi:MAG: ABC transporter ATP-binding protein [Halocynthiibacter sp.]
MVEPVLIITNLCKSFGNVKASDDISLDLRPGEIHALIGPNGAGKSTLIQQISGVLEPDSGDIRFLGQSLNGLRAATRTRLGLGRTFQVSSLAPEFSVLQNAMLGALGASGRVYRFFAPAMRDQALIERATEALGRVGLEARAQVRTADLSHGERRQLEVAVALTLRPRAFLMDEPMAGLGAGGSKRLTGFLDGLRTEAPILLIEHDMDAVFALADRISVLVYGRVIATGSREEIRANKDVQRAYLGEEA